MPLGPIDSYARVIVRLPNALGDTIMATGALARLASRLSPDQLAVVGLPVCVEALSGNPWAGKMIAYDRKGRHSGLIGMRALARELREQRFELGVIFPNSIDSALLFWFARIPERLGYFKEGRRVLLTAGRPRDKDERGHFTPKYTGAYFNELLDLIPGVPPAKSLHPRLFVDDEGAAQAQAWARAAGLGNGEPLLIVVPGAAFGPSKIWIPDRYAAVADELARRKGARILISYGPGEEAIAAAVRGALKTPALADARLSLRGLKAVFAHATFVLTNDTGPRHLAVAFGVPNVTIMGPNDPRYTHLDDERGEVVRLNVECSPCQLKKCPLPEKICMTRLGVDAVLEACLRQWPDAKEKARI